MNLLEPVDLLAEIHEIVKIIVEIIRQSRLLIESHVPVHPMLEIILLQVGTRHQHAVVKNHQLGMEHPENFVNSRLPQPIEDRREFVVFEQGDCDLLRVPAVVQHFFQKSKRAFLVFVLPHGPVTIQHYLYFQVGVLVRGLLQQFD